MENNPHLTPEGSESHLRVQLNQFQHGNYDPGRSFVIRSLWFLMNALILQNPFNPLSGIKGQVLRIFGAKLGKNIYFKPGINIKFPWYLTIGDDCWIGEGAWIDNLVPVTIGSNVCISQAAYLCTGNHDWSDVGMGYKLGEITVEDGAWVGTHAIVCPGLTVATHSIVSAGAVLTRSTEPYGIYAGNPATFLKKRVIRKS